MEKTIVNKIHQQKDLIVTNWLTELESVRSERYLEKISPTVYKNTNREFVEIIFNYLGQDQSMFNEKLNQFSHRLIQLGWPLSYLTEGLQAFRRVVFETVVKEDTTGNGDLKTYYEVESWVDQIVNLLVNEYSGAWENTIFLQKMALKELSAPLIPVFEKISVMPLIGTIDTERAKLIMENLLNGVIQNRSEVVLIDITGVPVVDTMVAHHIIQASEAVRLVGAKCILVGIRPEIAQTIVNLGIDLGNFPTKNTLKNGIEAALELTNKKIIAL